MGYDRMFKRNLLALLAVAAVWAVAIQGARAAYARFHYVPAEGSCLKLQPSAFFGTPGEVVTLLGRRSYNSVPRPTGTIMLYHTCTGRPVTVPLSLPEGTPNVQHRLNRVVYNYGSYTIEVHFLPDGSVDVIYNSGLLREALPGS